jgi:hypothetical protein
VKDVFPECVDVLLITFDASVGSIQCSIEHPAQIPDKQESECCVTEALFCSQIIYPQKGH